MQYHIQPLSLDKFGDPLHTFPAFTVSVSQCAADQPRLLTLRSADPAAAPVIHAELSGDAGGPPRRRRFDPLTRQHRRAAGAAAVFTGRISAGPRVRDDDDAALVKAAGDIGTTIFHPIGTAKMGLPSDPMMVVDERLRVVGIERLARHRRLGDADDHVRQHQCADHDDRGKGRRDAARRRQEGGSA